MFILTTIYILINNNIAIAVVASTEDVYYAENEILLNTFYNELSSYIQNPNNSTEIRLGTILYNAKNLNNCIVFSMMSLRKIISLFLC